MEYAWEVWGFGQGLGVWGCAAADALLGKPLVPDPWRCSRGHTIGPAAAATSSLLQQRPHFGTAAEATRSCVVGGRPIPMLVLSPCWSHPHAGPIPMLVNFTPCQPPLFLPCTEQCGRCMQGVQNRVAGACKVYRTEWQVHARHMHGGPSPASSPAGPTQAPPLPSPFPLQLPLPLPPPSGSPQMPAPPPRPPAAAASRTWRRSSS
eukprot:360505-Chlamydomonas_euryale.AAC.2